MRLFLIFIYLFLALLCKTCVPCSAMQILPNTPSLEFILKHDALITIEFDDEDNYFVTSNISNTELSHLNDKKDGSIIFGENTFTEDNVLRHFIFRQDNKKYNHVSQKLFPNCEYEINTHAP